jgi:S-DNA-T family DNA segregation ATPase FtsK/SpoIIIE
MLPDLVHLDEVRAVAVAAGCGRGGIPIALDEDGLAPITVDVGTDPHLVCFADAESG